MNAARKLLGYLRLGGRLATVATPWFIRKRLLRLIWGYELAPTARIGWSYVFPVHLQMGEGASIGNLSYVAGMDRVEVGPNAMIGNLNWITGLPADSRPAGFSTSTILRLGAESAITNRHYLDVQDTIAIGRYTTVAGVHSVILTHGIDYRTNQQASGAVMVGDHCLIGTNVVILPGALVGSRVIIAAGAVVTRRDHPGPGLYTGTPAGLKSTPAADCAYFTRTTGPVR